MKDRLKVRDFRDFIRFITVFLLVPWFGWFTEHLFGIEIEFEVELITFISFMIFGSFWCGWLCPFGNLSYYVSKIGEKLFPSAQVVLGGRADKILRKLKYVILLGFVYIIVDGGYNYFFGNHVEIYKSTTASFMFFKAKKYMIILLPLVFPRFFCKYICPQKAMYNIMHKFLPFLYIERDSSQCISCKRCDKKCPMGIEVSKKDMICGEDCISCMNCVDGNTCPEKFDALSLKFMGKKVDVIKISTAILLIYTIATYAALKIVH